MSIIKKNLRQMKVTNDELIDLIEYLKKEEGR